MKEIPILFSTEMVQAILAGRKTMTRRIMQPQPWYGSQIPGGPHFIYPPGSGQRFNAVVSKNGSWLVMQESFQKRFSEIAKWKIGDLLWVRENFRVNSWVPDDGEVTFRYEADGSVSKYVFFDDDDETINRYWQQSCDDLLKAGYKTNDEERFGDYDYKALRLRPNIFLPKVAARIWLEITDIRVERLQDISEEDAIAEGVEKRPGSNSSTRFDFKHYHWNHSYDVDAKVSFRTLWEKINGPESWDANPWVWVISFKVLSTTGKPDLQTEKTTA